MDRHIYDIIYDRTDGSPIDCPRVIIFLSSRLKNLFFWHWNLIFKWIQAGCGDKEYYCEEKGAVFLAGDMPDALPSLDEHK